MKNRRTKSPQQKPLMEKLLRVLIGPLVKDEKSIEIVKQEDGENRVNFLVSIPQEDIAKVIGKEGKMIKAIKNLLKIRAFKEGVYVTIEVREK